MSTTQPQVDYCASADPLPPRTVVEALATELLAGEGTRLEHVRGAALVASRLSVLFDTEDAATLVAAALLHDIGYAAPIAQTGFHPLDGAVFLRELGYPQRLTRLVAHHSVAILTAPAYGVTDLPEQFPPEEGLLADALTYADMLTAPDGALIHPDRRLADIARRHPDRPHAERAHHLRAAIHRVEAALAAAATGAPGRHLRVAAPRGTPVQPAPTLKRPATAGITSVGPRTHRAPPARPVPPGPPRAAFDDWWLSESHYELALRLYQPGTEDPAAAQRLARLRARADARRDRYFRAALT